MLVVKYFNELGLKDGLIGIIATIRDYYNKRISFKDFIEFIQYP